MTPETTDIRALQQLNEDIDQLAGCSALSPEADACLKLAWWFTEDAIREATGKCSNGCRGVFPDCMCCINWDRHKARARAFRSRL